MEQEAKYRLSSVIWQNREGREHSDAASIRCDRLALISLMWAEDTACKVFGQEYQRLCGRGRLDFFQMGESLNNDEVTRLYDQGRLYEAELLGLDFSLRKELWHLLVCAAAVLAPQIGANAPMSKGRMTLIGEAKFHQGRVDVLMVMTLGMARKALEMQANLSRSGRRGGKSNTGARITSSLPPREELLLEQQQLVERHGVDKRFTTKMLANRYGCSSRQVLYVLQGKKKKIENAHP